LLAAAAVCFLARLLAECRDEEVDNLIFKIH